MTLNKAAKLRDCAQLPARRLSHKPRRSLHLSLCEMSKPYSDTNILVGKVIRPAMLEIGVTNSGQLASTIKLYESLLGTREYPFRLVTDMALLCVVRSGGNTQTLIYWEVPGTTTADLTQEYNDLIKNHKCKGVKAPHKLPKPHDLRDDTEICTLTDEAGGEFGLVINPPYSFIQNIDKK